MKAPQAKRQLTIMEAQSAALKFAQNYITATPLGLPAEMTEEDFTKVMNAITRAIINGWADGYFTAVKP